MKKINSNNGFKNFLIDEHQGYIYHPEFASTYAKANHWSTISHASNYYIGLSSA